MCTKIKYSIDPVPLIACTLTTDNLLTLANIVTTSGIDHHHPPSLGVFTSRNIADGSSAVDKWWTAKFIAAGQLFETVDDSNPEEMLAIAR